MKCTSVLSTRSEVLSDFVRRASVSSPFNFSLVLLHPSLHARDVCLHGQDSGVCLVRRTGLKQTCAISKRLVADRMSFNQRAERRGVENAEKGTKN